MQTTSAILSNYDYIYVDDHATWTLNDKNQLNYNISMINLVIFYLWYLQKIVALGHNYQI